MVAVKVIAVQHIDLHRGLVFDGHPHRGEPAAEQLRHGLSVKAAAVPVGAPEGIDLAQVCPALPVLAVNCLAHSRPIGAGRAAEHPQSCLLRRLVFAQALGDQPLPLLVGMFFDKVLLRALVQAGHSQHRPLHQLHHIGEGITEQAADAQHSIDARTAQFLQRMGLYPHHLVGLPQIEGTHTHQGEHLCDVLAMGFHTLVGVDHDSHALRPGLPSECGRPQWPAPPVSAPPPRRLGWGRPPDRWHRNSGRWAGCGHFLGMGCPRAAAG